MQQQTDSIGGGDGMFGEGGAVSAEEAWGL